MGQKRLGEEEGEKKERGREIEREKKRERGERENCVRETERDR